MLGRGQKYQSNQSIEMSIRNYEENGKKGAENTMNSVSRSGLCPRFLSTIQCDPRDDTVWAYGPGPVCSSVVLGSWISLRHNWNMTSGPGKRHMKGCPLSTPGWDSRGLWMPWKAAGPHHWLLTPDGGQGLERGHLWSGTGGRFVCPTAPAASAAEQIAVI